MSAKFAFTIGDAGGNEKDFAWRAGRLKEEGETIMQELNVTIEVDAQARLATIEVPNATPEKIGLVNGLLARTLHSLQLDASNRHERE